MDMVVTHKGGINMRGLHKLISSVISISIIFLTISISALNVSAVSIDSWLSDTSAEYRSSQNNGVEYNYYGRLKQNVSNNMNSSVSNMEKAFRIAKSQLNWDVNKKASKTYGYANYSTINGDHNWTGKIKKMNYDNTGNTEYTRWFFTKFKTDSGQKYPNTLDCDWCSIFVSWCMYYSGYHKGYSDMRKVYSAYADPRKDLAMPLTSFNMDPNKVWYTSTANKKLNEYNYKEWNKAAKKRNQDPLKIPYKRGGLLFFSWDGSGNKWCHVGMVYSYDKAKQKLTYISGNDEGRVLVRTMYLNKKEYFNGSSAYILNSKRIMAYAEY